MEINKRTPVEYESRYSWLLVFAFLCGSMLSLLYMPEGLRSANFSPEASILCLAVLLPLLPLLSTSVCGRALLPLCFVAFGIMTALDALAACREFYVAREQFYRRAVTAALLTPPCFVMGVAGMRNSERLCSALAAEGSIGKKQYIGMYTMMAAAAAVSSLLLAYAVLK